MYVWWGGVMMYLGSSCGRNLKADDEGMDRLQGSLVQAAIKRLVREFKSKVRVSLRAVTLQSLESFIGLIAEEASK